MAKQPNVSTQTIGISGLSVSERLTRALAKLKLIATPEQEVALLEYLTQLLRWNKTYNLTAIRDPNQALVHHIFDSLSLVNPIQRTLNLSATSIETIIDVGSGGGLPGVILAIMLPTVKVTCVDAVEKKALFVRQMAGVLALKNLSGLHARIETLEPLHSTLVTSRAFASLTDFAQLAGKHVCEQGHLLAMKGITPTDEISALSTLTTWSAKEVEPLTVPELEAQRCLVWMQRKGT